MPSSTPTHPLPPTELVATSDAGERLLTRISSARGAEIAELPPRSSDHLAVYIRCVGDGFVTIEISGVISFTQPCDSLEGPGTRNTIDFASARRPLTVIGAMTGTAIWAVAVTEIPPR